MNRRSRYERLLKIFFDYKFKRLKGRVLPLRIWLEPTNVCNLKCPVCPQSTDKKSPRGNMPIELYCKIIDEIADHVYDINLSHRGESLFHPNICDMIAYAHERGIRTRIHTNGTILTPELSKQLIQSGLDFLSFSFDGFSKADYESSRVGACYDETLKNIQTCLTIKQELNSQTPFTVIQVIQTDNSPFREMIKEKESFLSHFQALPLDKLYIKDPHNWGGIIENETATRLSQNQEYSPCTFCWYAITILWDGTVVPCPQDFFAVLKMGNLKETSLKEIWRGEKMVSLRNKFVSRMIDSVTPCNVCDRLFRKQLLGIPVVNMKEFLSENIIGYSFLADIYRKQWKTGN